QDMQAAVVRGENNERVASQTQSIELGQKTTYGIIERLDHRCVGRVESVFVLGDELFFRDERHVRVVMAKKEKKRFLFIAFDKFLGFPRQFVLALAALGGGRQGLRLTGV